MFLGYLLTRSFSVMNGNLTSSSTAAGSQTSADAPQTPQTPQLALLELFFPGFSVFANAVQKYLGIDLNVYIPLVLLGGVLIVIWNYANQYFWDQLESHFMSVVDIRTDDEIYNILMAWVARQQFSQGARRFVVNTNLNSRCWYLWSWDDDESDDSGEASRSEAKKKKALSYTPSFGTHYFFYKGYLLLFRRSLNRDQNSHSFVSQREEISVSCFGRNPQILKELLLDARQQYMEKDEQKTLIYRGTTRPGSLDPSWQRCLARAIRPFSTVILNEQKKREVIADVEDYLCPETQRWYSNRGIPYRRGYLLYGPPGTGKSSLSLALAGHFKMRIYIVSLSSITANEETLAALFAELPRRCVVLLEDIDTAGLTHTREENQPRNQPVSTDTSDEMVPGQLTTGNGNVNNSQPTQPAGRLSLSGLLNILDGVASQEGRVLIMTTNHVEKLDKALIRPGRIDMMVEFGRADKDMTSAIFRAIFARLEGDEGPPSVEYLSLDQEARDLVHIEMAAKRAAHDAQVDILAEEFASKIPAHEFSPAELQGFLMRHKRDSQAAVANAEDFVEQTRKDRKEQELLEAEQKRKEEEQKAEEAKKKEKEKEAKKEKTKEKTEEAKKETDEPAQEANGEAEPTEESKLAEGKEKLVGGHKRDDSGYASPASDKA